MLLLIASSFFVLIAVIQMLRRLYRAFFLSLIMCYHSRYQLDLRNQAYCLTQNFRMLFSVNNSNSLPSTWYALKCNFPQVLKTYSHDAFQSLQNLLVRFETTSILNKCSRSLHLNLRLFLDSLIHDSDLLLLQSPYEKLRFASNLLSFRGVFITP